MKTLKVLFTALLILISFNSQSQILDPNTIELEIQRYEIQDINERFNKSIDLISEAGRQKNLAVAIGVGGGLISSLILINGKTKSTINTGYVIGGMSLVGSLYLTIKSNDKLSQAGNLKL